MCIFPLFPASPGLGQEAGALDLQLEVSINGHPIGMIGAFSLSPDGRMAATRGELAELGIMAPGEGPADQAIALEDVPGVAYRYDDASQTVDITAPDSARVVQNIDALLRPGLEEAAGGRGMIINYVGFGEAGNDLEKYVTSFNGANLSLDARAYSEYGIVDQSGIVGTTSFSDANALRLDTTWSLADPDDIRDYRVGDFISGGLNWTRPLRMGGAQMQSNFTLRPDLITMPLPSVSGSAAVPSTIDVYVDGVRNYSRDVQPGPYQLDNLPVTTGSGTARVVLTDANGQQVVSESEFYAAPELLRPGLMDYSIEAGFARRNYGSESFSYDEQPGAIGSLRRGITDDFTLELHAEASLDLLEGGAGGVFNSGWLGDFSGAAAVSLYQGNAGFLLYGAWDTEYAGFAFSASAQHAFNDYADLATIAGGDIDDDNLGNDFPSAVDQLSISYGLPDYQASVGASLIHMVQQGDRSLIASSSVTKAFDNNLSVFANALYDFGDDQGYGVFVGLSMPLGNAMSAFGGVNFSPGHVSGVGEVVKSMDATPGSYGWRVSHGEGDSGFTGASASYRASKAVLSAGLYQQGDSVTATASVDGAVVVADGDVFLSNHIDDGFAVVDVGAAGVGVSVENQPAGSTGADGKLLVPNLHAYQKNKIALDVTTLPITAEVPSTEAVAVPRGKSGVVVGFGIKPDVAAAIVVLTDGEGRALPVGTEVELAESRFVVGYDGETYVSGLGASNLVRAVSLNGGCEAKFDFNPSGDAQPRIGPVPCI